MNNSFIIKNLLDKDEDTRLEFKADVSQTSIGKIVTSLINTEGGDVVIGVNDHKEVIGLEHAERKLATLQRTLLEDIKPEAPISFQIINYKGNDVILISTWEGANKPYQFKSIIYVRENTRTKISDASSIANLIAERKNADFHWERRTVLGADIEDLSQREIEKTIVLYKERNSKVTIEDNEDFLIQTGLIKNNNLTNACVLLFANTPVRFIPQSPIRITVFPGRETGDTFIGDRLLNGNLFENIIDTLEYLDIVFGKTIEVVDNLRTEKQNYPHLAIREALMNAVVHRDYNSVNSFLQISVFSDRTEISNYGTLPEGITIKDLKKEHNSILRNPDIAQICFTRRYIEMLGSGTLRMINDCKVNGFKQPKWEESEKTFKVVFEGVKHKNSNEGVSEGVNEGVKYLSFEGVNEGVNKALNDVLSIIRNNPELNTTEIANQIGKGISTTERYLKVLKDENLIVFLGSPRTGGYVLKAHLDNLK